MGAFKHLQVISSDLPQADKVKNNRCYFRCGVDAGLFPWRRDAIHNDRVRSLLLNSCFWVGCNMSLFKVKEWWTSSAGETDEFDCTSWCTAKLFSLEPDGRDQLVIGGHSGTLWIFDPGNNADESGSAPLQPFKPEHLLLEQRMDHPIVQVAAGRFVTGAHHHQLAVLFPRKLAVFTMRSTESSQVQHGAQHSLNRIYEHLLPRTAFNMAWGPFGGVQDKDYMCVQSLDGTLSFYENENFAFSRFLPSALLPGPLAFVPLADCFITVSSSWTLESYKYQVLAVAVDAKTKEQAATMTTGKRVAPDWSFELGENAIDLAVVEISPAQPSIVVLGERTVFCFTEGGTLRFMRKLDYNPVCLLAYTATSEGFLQYLIGSDTRTLMLYADTTLIWTAQLAYTPVGRPGGRLETIMEDTNVTDASEMELGEADVPIGSQFGALQSGTLATTIDMDEQAPLDDEFNEEPATPRQPAPAKPSSPQHSVADGAEETPTTNGMAAAEEAEE
uniref:PTHB1 N-terminal domain-containing protein n=1 Tax=Plectus sambesii TaxID=2011161 RepID=A0A914UPG1_9BILA